MDVLTLRIFLDFCKSERIGKIAWISLLKKAFFQPPAYSYGYFCSCNIEDWYCATHWPLPTPPVSTVCPLSASTEAPSCLKTKEHDVLQRQRVVDLWKDGKSEGTIGQELRMPKSTVHSIIVKYRLSNTVENLPRNGRPKKPWSERAMKKESLRLCGGPINWMGGYKKGGNV